MSSHSPTNMVDRIAMVIGGGLIILGTVVMDFFETVIGSPHALPQTNEAGEIVAHTTFSPTLRANIIALGIAIWGVYAIYLLASRHPE